MKVLCIYLICEANLANTYPESLMAFTLTTQEAAGVLRISRATLARLRKDGILKAGVHYRAMGAGSLRPPLIWNEEAIELTLTQRSRRVLD